MKLTVQRRRLPERDHAAGLRETVERFNALRAQAARKTASELVSDPIRSDPSNRITGKPPASAVGILTFKSHHETLDAWAVTELVAHSVAYRKAVSPSPAKLLPEDQFRLFAVCVNRPREVPWQQRGPGVYDCLWGTDTVRVVVTGEVSRQPHNAPWHLFSDSATCRTWQASAAPPTGDARRTQTPCWTSCSSGIARRELPRGDREDVLRSLPAEELLAILPLEQIRQYLDRATAGHKAGVSEPRRKK